MFTYVLSTIAGVESIAKKEIEKQGGIIKEVFDRLIIFSGGIEMIPKINIWSRVGNKMYMLLAEGNNVTNFDSLFDIVGKINWKQYWKQNFPIVVNVTSVRSELNSTPTMQRIVKKAIVNSLSSGAFLREDDTLEPLEIFVLVIDNKVRILLNTSGKALHMRGYRRDAGEAPIKESLAAALVLLSDWRFKDNFHDLFCGSGTIAIEALMIAKNIAPGLKRSFAFERLGLVDKNIVETERKTAQEKVFDQKYTIFASDIDKNAVEMARENAKRAGLEGQITFAVRDFRDFLNEGIEGTLVSNPPYGLRLQDSDMKSLYNDIDKLFRLNPKLGGGIISSFMEFDKLIKEENYKKRKLYNGAEKCYFWRRKNS